MARPGPTERAGRTGFHLGYQPGLDGLRGVSVVVIMVFHSFILWPESYARGIPGSFLAVNLFFVLSGFLITALLLDERARNGAVAFGAFYVRRALRLLPALVLVLTVATAHLWLSGQPMRAQLAAMGWTLGYVANWAQWTGAIHDPITKLTWGHTWTLSVEEQFYLLWPLLFVGVLLRRLRIEVVAAVLAFAVLVITVGRQVAAAGVRVPAGTASSAVVLAGRLDEHIGLRTDFRADTLLLGALAAIALHAGWRPGRGLRWVASGAGAGLVAALLWVRPEARWMYGWGFTAVDLGFALVCVAALDRRWRPGLVLRFPPLVWLGRVSYGLYLWHPPVFMAVLYHWPHASVAARLALGWGFTLAAAWLSFTFVEQPFLRLKARWSRREAAAAAAPVVVGTGA
jgi:peptidoglycan/LPS O-acetylase OafA/YrhL